MILTFCGFDTKYDDKTDEVNIDWDSCEIEANYSYHCDICGYKIANTAEEVKNLYKEYLEKEKQRKDEE